MLFKLAILVIVFILVYYFLIKKPPKKHLGRGETFSYNLKANETAKQERLLHNINSYDGSGKGQLDV